ncbi:DUF4124 domain-containing protein [Oleiagrimonas sp. MCCC 1A03011]|uniref:DUF4124 domain-containing protein n=1 Tax=Oleiagrimonas sp. MCCC 1A03011 TaxID=1926883 RepID=UPI000DC3A267|nr:DUF4124 domain-containing protein [Oleiagrimonas sp. MCCC 1A03011]RAP58532.1 hypothetical protein BTJ49_06285 [Oleiagrimonas sp. MCCC 1A03011]
MRGTLTTLLTTMLLALPLVASAQVYKWTDANGTQHFSDAPPPQGVKYQNIKTRADADQPRTSGHSDEVRQAADSSASASSTSQGKGKNSQMQRFCAQLQSNITLLKSSQSLQRLDGNGKSVPVDDQQRAEQLKQQQQRYQAYCSQ